MALVGPSPQILTPPKHDIVLRAGVTFSFEWEALLEDGTALDVTGATLFAHARSRDGRLLATFLATAVDSNTSGRFAITLPQAIATLTFENNREFYPARWSCKAQFPGTLLTQSSFKLAEGAVTLEDRQTESAVA